MNGFKNGIGGGGGRGAVSIIQNGQKRFYYTYSMIFGGRDDAAISTWPGDLPSIVPSILVMSALGLNSKLVGIISTTPLCDASNVTFTFLS